MKQILLILFFSHFICILKAQTITNGSFEESPLSLGNSFVQLEQGSNQLNGWVVESSIDYIGSIWETPDGERSIDLNSFKPGAVSQSINTTMGTTYFVEFNHAGNPNCSPNLKVLQVFAAVDTAVYTFDISNATEENMNWVIDTFEFTAVETATKITFSSLSTAKCGPVIDHVRLVEIDCAGVSNGTAITDDCGVCLERNDPNFNQSCVDCAGVPNGIAVIDSCGTCLDRMDANFNKCFDCAGVINGTGILDDCGVCLDQNDPNFNQSCLDCAGVPNGIATIDSCGVCLEQNDPNFNQSCVDCAGVPNGLAEVDDCGECLERTDSNYNLSCIDCAGVLNGTAVIDDCGQCLEITASDFNRSCESEIYIPNVFSPNDDGINDRFEIFKKVETNIKVKKYAIFNRWGDALYELTEFDLNANSNWWDGRFKGKKVQSGNYLYYIEIEFLNGSMKIYTGSISVLKG